MAAILTDPVAVRCFVMAALFVGSFVLVGGYFAREA